MINMNNTQLTFLDLFSGIGGFRIAAEKNNMKCIGFSEIDKDALTTYKYNFDTRKEYNFSDISTIKTSRIPNFDILLAGFPCQTFSCAGNQLGFDDDRGNLFFQIYRILKDKRPKAFLLENVANLVYHDNKHTFNTIIQLLSKETNHIQHLVIKDDCLEYHVHYKIINSKEFGVAQSRNRIYIVGFDKQTNFKFPKSYENIVTFGDIKENKKNYLGYIVNETSYRKRLIQECKENNTILYDNCIANTLLTKQDRRHTCGLVPMSNGYRFLTEKELSRLQSFPKNYKIPFGYSLETVTKLFGNSITVNVVEEIIREMLIAMNS